MSEPVSKLWGLSLSACVLAILRGDRQKNDVEGIIAGTKFESPQQCWEHYRHGTFFGYRDEQVLPLLTELWPKIEQPRMEGLTGHYASPLWLTSTTHPIRVQVDEYSAKYFSADPGCCCNEPAER